MKRGENRMNRLGTIVALGTIAMVPSVGAAQDDDWSSVRVEPFEGYGGASDYEASPEGRYPFHIAQHWHRHRHSDDPHFRIWVEVTGCRRDDGRGQICNVTKSVTMLGCGEHCPPPSVRRDEGVRFHRYTSRIRDASGRAASGRATDYWFASWDHIFAINTPLCSPRIWDHINEINRIYIERSHVTLQRVVPQDPVVIAYETKLR